VRIRRQRARNAETSRIQSEDSVYPRAVQPHPLARSPMARTALLVSEPEGESDAVCTRAMQDAEHV
jgi:hypothetical protein